MKNMYLTIHVHYPAMKSIHKLLCTQLEESAIKSEAVVKLEQLKIEMEEVRMYACNVFGMRFIHKMYM